MNLAKRDRRSLVLWILMLLCLCTLSGESHAPQCAHRSRAGCIGNFLFSSTSEFAELRSQEQSKSSQIQDHRILVLDSTENRKRDSVYNAFHSATTPPPVVIVAHGKATGPSLQSAQLRRGLNPHRRLHVITTQANEEAGAVQVANIPEKKELAAPGDDRRKQEAIQPRAAAVLQSTQLRGPDPHKSTDNHEPVSLQGIKIPETQRAFAPGVERGSVMAIRNLRISAPQSVQLRGPDPHKMQLPKIIATQVENEGLGTVQAKRPMTKSVTATGIKHKKVVVIQKIRKKEVALETTIIVPKRPNFSRYYVMSGRNAASTLGSD